METAAQPNRDVLKENSVYGSQIDRRLTLPYPDQRAAGAESVRETGRGDLQLLQVLRGRAAEEAGAAADSVSRGCEAPEEQSGMMEREAKVRVTRDDECLVRSR